MSFILDALKKSESERQRQNGPALFEVKVAPPRHRFAIWGTALGALLAINLVVVGWMLARGSSSRTAAPAAPPAPAAAAPAAAAPVPASATPPLLSRSTTPAPASTAQSSPAPAPAAAMPSSAGNTQPGGPETVARAGLTARAASGAPDASANPEDLAPAVDPRRHPAGPESAGSDAGGSSGGGSVVRETESGLPTYQDAAAAPGADIPSLRLDLHVYAADPEQRFVFVNMTKLHEGDSLPQGVRVDAITPDGVILSYRGTKFVLQR